MSGTVLLLSLAALAALVACAVEYETLSLDALHRYHDHSSHPHHILFANGHVIDTRAQAAARHARQLADGKVNPHQQRVAPTSLQTHDALDTISSRHPAHRENDARLLIVQLAGPVTSAAKLRVEAALNVRLQHYLPHHAFLVSLTGGAAAERAFASRARGVRDVLWLGRHRSEYKRAASLHATILSRAPSVAVEAVVAAAAHGSLVASQWPGVRAILLSSSEVHVSAASLDQVFHLVRGRPRPGRPRNSLPDSFVQTRAVAARMLSQLKRAFPSAHVWLAEVDTADHIDFVIPHAADLSRVADFLGSFEAVHVVEHRSPARLRNKWARGIMQSGTVNEHPDTVFCMSRDESVESKPALNSAIAPGQLIYNWSTACVYFRSPSCL